VGCPVGHGRAVEYASKFSPIRRRRRPGLVKTKCLFDPAPSGVLLLAVDAFA
jgi:hypothetical protein